jgi:hypothetical protein
MFDIYIDFPIKKLYNMGTIRYKNIPRSDVE